MTTYFYYLVNASISHNLYLYFLFVSQSSHFAGTDKEEMEDSRFQHKGSRAQCIIPLSTVKVEKVWQRFLLEQTKRICHRRILVAFRLGVSRGLHKVPLLGATGITRKVLYFQKLHYQFHSSGRRSIITRKWRSSTAFFNCFFATGWLQFKRQKVAHILMVPLGKNQFQLLLSVSQNSLVVSVYRCTCIFQKTTYLSAYLSIGITAHTLFFIWS